MSSVDLTQHISSFPVRIFLPGRCFFLGFLYSSTDTALVSQVLLIDDVEETINYLTSISPSILIQISSGNDVYLELTFIAIILNFI